MDHATYDATNDEMEQATMEVIAVQDKGVWYVEMRNNSGVCFREKVENAKTPNTREAALDLVEQTQKYILYTVVRRALGMN
jgi:hypothetical protein